MTAEDKVKRPGGGCGDGKNGSTSAHETKDGTNFLLSTTTKPSHCKISA
jgi:hypothetical protein